MKLYKERESQGVCDLCPCHGLSPRRLAVGLLLISTAIKPRSRPTLIEDTPPLWWWDLGNTSCFSEKPWSPTLDAWSLKVMVIITLTFITVRLRFMCAKSCMKIISRKVLLRVRVSCSALGWELRESLSLWDVHDCRLFVVWSEPLSRLDGTWVWRRHRRMSEFNAALWLELKLPKHQRIIRLRMSLVVPVPDWPMCLWVLKYTYTRGWYFTHNNAECSHLISAPMTLGSNDCSRRIHERHRTTLGKRMHVAKSLR